MQELHDDRILALYVLARQDYAAGIAEDQKIAINELKDLSRSGNLEAGMALERLNRLPTIHPFLKEILIA